MTSELLPLPIYGVPRRDDVQALRDAKAALDLPFLITLVEAVPGSPTRIIALRDPLPFLGDHALVADPSNPVALQAAMYWALHPEHHDPRATTVLDQLNLCMKTTEIREITDELRLDLDD